MMFKNVVPLAKFHDYDSYDVNPAPVSGHLWFRFWRKICRLEGLRQSDVGDQVNETNRKLKTVLPFGGFHKFGYPQVDSL